MVAFDRNNDSYLTVVKIGVQDQEDRGIEIIKAWLPISSQVLTSDLAAALNLTDKTGVRVTQVYANTPAEKAGLKVGDVIVALDGTTIEASQPEDTEVLPAMIREYPIGSNVELTVFRDGNEQKIKIELPAAPKPAREMKKYRDENYDFSGRDIAFMDRINEEWDESQTGVIVDSVTDGGWAALGQIRVGDLLYSLNGQTITDVSSLEAVMQKIAEEKPTTVIAQVKRGIHECFLELQASWPKEAR
jgi:serine protease Do